MRNIKHIKKFVLISVIIIAAVLILTPLHRAHADPLTDIALGAVTQFFATLLYLIFYTTGKLISWMALLLNWVITIPVYPKGGLPVVQDSWKILRDLANTIFIVALVITAFATIFDIGFGAVKQFANWREMLVKVVVAAVLINFSMVIGVVVIDIAQVPTNTMLSAIGDISVRLGEGLNPAKFLPLLANQQLTTAQATATMANALMNSILGLVIALIFTFSFLVSMTTAAVIALIRIPILWAMLIISPVFWIAYIFPGSRKSFQWWWSTFIGWNLFLPYFLFMLYFALLILSKQTEVTASLAGTFAQEDMGITGLVSLNLQDIVGYVLVCITLLGGTAVAMKASFISSSGVGNMAQKVSGWTKGALGRVSYVSALRGAAGEKLKEIRQYGIGPYGGEAAEKLRQARVERLLGVRGAERPEFKAQKDFTDKSDKEFKLIEQDYKVGKIDAATVASRASATSASSPQGFAYKKMAAELGVLNPELFENTLKELGNNARAAEIFVQSAKKAKFSNLKPNELIKTATDPVLASNKNMTPARREMFKYIQSDKKMAAKLDENGFEQAVKVFGGKDTAETKMFMKDMGKARPDLVADYKIKTGHFGKPEDPRLRVALIYGELRDKSTKDVAQMPDIVWLDGSFQEALNMHLGILEKNDPPRKEKGKKAYAGGAANFKTTLKKNVAKEWKKLKILKVKIRPDLGEGEAFIEEAEKAEKAESPKTEEKEEQIK